MKNVKMLFVVTFLAIVMCACGENKTNEDANNVEVASGNSEILNDENKGEEITFTSGLTLENNDMYDGARREFKYDKLLASYGDIEIYGDEYGNIISNVEGAISFNLLVKNTGNNDVAFSYTDYKLSGSFYENVIEEIVLFHPNGAPNYFLSPGEEHVTQIDVTLFNELNNEDLEGDLIIDLDIGILQDSGNFRKEKLRLQENVKKVSQKTFESAEYCNAVVSGVVKDEMGNPISKAKIEVVTSLANIRKETVTNDDGSYSITVPATKSSFSNAWREAALFINIPGYAQRGIPLYPKNNQTITADVTLYPQTEGLIYEQTKKVDLGIQAYENDAAGESIVFVPFHSGYDQSTVGEDCRATMTDLDGNVDFSYVLPQEIPFVDMSTDGQYVILPIDYLEGGFKIVILNKDGTEFYETKKLEETKIANAPNQKSIDSTMSRCAQLSNNNKYLGVGDTEGDFWLIDIDTDEVLFSDCAMAQVRNIKFTKDDSELYVSDGAGNVVAYDLSGNVIWKCNIMSWATEMELTEKYVVCTTKCAGNNLNIIDRKTGELVWNYPTLQSCKSLSISPDEKYIWYGAHSSSAYSIIGCSIFDIETGKLISILDPEEHQEGVFSSDGSKIVVKGRKKASVYDAKNGTRLYTYNLADEDDTFNCSIYANADLSKFVMTAANTERDGYYGVAYYFKCAGTGPIEDTIDNTAVVDSNKEYFMVGVRANMNIDAALDKHGNVLTLYDHDGSAGELIALTGQVQGKPFNEALPLILDHIGRKGRLKKCEHLEIDVMKVAETKENMLTQILFDAENICKDLAQTFDVSYDVTINDSQYEVISINN